jgi:hypothetical protein
MQLLSFSVEQVSNSLEFWEDETPKMGRARRDRATLTRQISVAVQWRSYATFVISFLGTG